MRFLITACGLVTGDESGLRAWINHHLELGIEQIHIYVRDMDRLLLIGIEPILDSGQLKIYPWPEPLSQSAAYLHASRGLQGRCDWLLCMGVDHYLRVPPAMSLLRLLNGFAANHGAICLQPTWQFDLGQLEIALKSTPASHAVQLARGSEPGVAGNSSRPQLIFMVRPDAVNGFHQGLQLAEGWQVVNETGQHWACEPELRMSRQHLIVDCYPLGLPHIAIEHSAEESLDGSRHCSDESVVTPALHGPFLPSRHIPHRYKLSDVLQPGLGASGSETPEFIPGCEALTAFMATLACGINSPRVLMLGDMPLALVSAAINAGFQLDLIEGVPAQADVLRQHFNARRNVRIVEARLDQLHINLQYDLIVYTEGEGYACNRPAGATKSPRDCLAAALVDNGRWLVVNATGAASHSEVDGRQTFLVLPDWSRPDVLCRREALNVIHSELALQCNLPAKEYGLASLDLLHGSPATLKPIQALLGISAANPAMRRVHEWQYIEDDNHWLRQIVFFAPAADIQSRLGVETLCLDRESLTGKSEPRLIEHLREVASNGDFEAFIASLRAWVSFLREHADMAGCLPGHWLDALPAQVRRLATGELTFDGGEWRQTKPIDIRVVVCLGLWQLVAATGFTRVLPEAPALVVLRWLQDLVACRTDTLWLEFTAGIHSLLGLSPLAAVSSHQDAYTAQLPDMVLKPAALQAIHRRLAAGVGLPRLAVLLWSCDRPLDQRAEALSIQSVQHMIYPTPLPIVTAHAAEAAGDVRAKLAELNADWVYVVEPGDTLDPASAWILAERVFSQPQLVACYVDEDCRIEGQRRDPIFKPDFNLDLLRGYAYTGRGLVFNRSALVETGFDTRKAAATAADSLLRLVEAHGPGAIGHIADVLYSAYMPYDQWLAQPALTTHWPEVVQGHLNRLGIACQLSPGPITGSVQVKYLHSARPLVSIIVPSRNQLHLLTALIESLLGKTAYPHFELLIVDNGSDAEDACRYLDGLAALGSSQIRVLRYPQPFNYSAMNNLAASQARGEYLLLLNNDTAILEPQWLEAMLHHAMRPEVGIVGAKLYFPDGRIQHAGVVMGLDQVAGHPFIGSPAHANGYMHRLQFDQNYSVVTAACLLIRASIYHEVGGLDEKELTVSYNDVDLCLKVQSAGYLTVWTPHARVMHHGSVSQTQLDSDQQMRKLARFKAEQETMCRRWLPWMAADPAYNRNLTLLGAGFELDPYRHIAWQPFIEKPLARIVCHPADRTGCGHYRIRQPFLAMQREGIADGCITEALLTPVTLARFEADTVILQRQHTDAQREALRRYLRCARVFKVFELDDYMFNVPLKSVHRAAMPKDLRKQLREAVAMTDRFVVSTQVLAEQFADMHDDIRVVLNRLPTDWWGGLQSARRVSAKPRVGWGGGSSHTGDLEMIADVVRELADEVDWVFFGMCPDKLRPYVKEFHNGVPIEQYPAKLASLNLDLALAPLEDNLFNHCKSNLRLLEYGACGFPVVCSDLITYRGDLPVTRVKNRFKDWVAAIRMHLADLDATAAMGDALREQVRRDWMLTGQHLVEWRDAWLP